MGSYQHRRAPRRMLLTTIGGVQLTIDASLLLLVLLLTWGISSGLRQHLDGGVQLIAALLTALLLIATILLHELAHAWAARRLGLTTGGITLFFFGGVLEIRQEPPAPRVELLIAAAGPLASLLVGKLLLLLSEGADGAGALLLGWLGAINLLLAGFNLLPALPLDGGRMLRAVLWAHCNDRRRATQLSLLLGQGFGLLLALAGALALAGVLHLPGRGASAAWTLLTGGFLYGTATISKRRIRAQLALAGVPVSQLMRPEATGVTPQHSLVDVFEGHVARGANAAPVLEGERLLGLICLADMRRVERASWRSTTVGAVMTPAAQIQAAAPNDDAGHALTLMLTQQLRQLPVLDGQRLVGMLHRNDLLRWAEQRRKGVST